MSQARILAFSGSARKESFNQKLVSIAAAGAEEAGASVTLISLADFPMPLFNEDLEAESGLPENAWRLRQLFLQHDGLLISCPEYNSSITPLLKNTIDWVSRPVADEPGLAAYQNKVAALISASPGGLGGLRGLVHVRAILGNIGVLVLPKQIAIGQAHEAFADDKTLVDAKKQESVQELGRALAAAVSKWH